MVVKKYIQKYPLKPFIQVVYPIVSIIMLVILCFVTMYNVPIAYDGKKAYRFTTWCVYTRDVIYVKEDNGMGYHTAYSYTPSGIKRNTIENNGDLCLKVLSTVRNKKMQYQSVKIPSEVNGLIFENYDTYISLKEGVKTNIDTIYLYDSYVTNITFTDNSYDTITVYYNTYGTYINIYGIENLKINYIRID